MHWWRLRRKAVAGLGLFALLLQVVLSFGHVHSRDLLVPRAGAASPKQIAIGKTSTAPGQEQIPGGIPDNDCPICTTMHMAASGLLPTPPSVVGLAELPQLFHHAFIEELNLGVTRHILFQTRAPPIA
jgi:hypothetical protein